MVHAHKVIRRYLHIDGILGNVSLDPEIVVVSRIAFKCAKRTFHLACSPPCSCDDFSYATHGLRVGAYH